MTDPNCSSRPSFATAQKARILSIVRMGIALRMRRAMNDAWVMHRRSVTIANMINQMPKETPHNSLGAAEREAFRKLETELEEPMKFSMLGYNAIISSLASLGDIPLKELRPSRRVTTSLLLRLANDLRCCSLLAAGGYPAQACSLATSAHEAMVTLVAIGNDDEAALRWLEHDDPTQSFGRPWQLTLSAMEKMAAEGVEMPSGPLETAKRLYRDYQQMCMPKHLNPLFERGMGHEIEGRHWAMFCGPDTSDQGIRSSWFALDRCVKLALWAIMAFFRFQSPNRTPPEPVAGQLREIVTAGQRLTASVFRRWPTADQDPFPGKWERPRKKRGDRAREDRSRHGGSAPPNDK